MPKSSVLRAACLTLLLASPACAERQGEVEQSQAAPNATLEAAIAADWRAEDRARDQHRNPYETLSFFQVEPGMTVVDYAPGSWYARILVPYLGSDGEYIGAIGVYKQGSASRLASQKAFPEDFPQEINGLVEAAGIEGGAPVSAFNSLTDTSDLTGSVDRVLVFRFMHNLLRRDIAVEELGTLHRLLKDDGLLGIVQHRAKADAPDSYTDGNNGYLKQQDVIDFVEGQGFELVSSSEINGNPKDTADHIGGVWQIPPAWASRDEAKKAIGESDRMTLLFRKSS